MSNHSDKSSPADSPQDSAKPAPAPSAEQGTSVGLPSYMAKDGRPEKSNYSADTGDFTAGHPLVPPDDHKGGDDADESGKAAGEGSAIAIGPDGTAHIPSVEQTPKADAQKIAAATENEADKNTGDDAAPGLSWPGYAAQTATGAGSRPFAKSTPDSSTPGKAAPGSKAPASARQTDAKDNTAAAGSAKPPRASALPFGKSHPILTVEQTMPPSMASRLYVVFSVLPLLWLTLSIVLQTMFSLDARGLWIGEETQNAALLQSLLSGGAGILPTLSGEYFIDKPPLYIWFLRGLYELVRTDGPMLHLAAAAVSCLFYLWAALGLGRCVGRLDSRSNLAAGIILVSTGVIMALVHYGSAILLFMALVSASMILVYRAYIGTGDNSITMALGFILAGAATLIQGLPGLFIPILSITLFALWRGSLTQICCVLVSTLAMLLGMLPVLYGLPILQAMGRLPDAQALSMEWSLALLALPALLLAALAALAPKLRICAALSFLLMMIAFVLIGGTPLIAWPPAYALPCLLSALFLLWQATPQRLFKADFFIGLVVGLAVIAVWPTLVYLQSDNSLLLSGSLLRNSMPWSLPGSGHGHGWSDWAIFLPLLLPWLAIIPFLPWQRVFGKAMREGITTSRLPEKEGLAFLWCALLAALAVASVFKSQSAWLCLTALAPLAALAGRSVLGFNGRQASLFRLTMAVLLLGTGVLTILYALMIFNILPQPNFLGLPAWTIPNHGGFFVVGAILLVSGALIWFSSRSSRPEGILLIMLLAATGLGYPLGSLIAPGFDSLLSPKEQALTLKAYANNGYTLAKYKTPPGAYTFYATSDIANLEAVTPESLAELGPKAALAMPLADYKTLNGIMEGFAVAQQQWMGYAQYVLLASPLIQDLAPAPVSYKPAPAIIHELLRSIGLGGWLESPAPDKEKATPTPNADSPVQNTDDAPATPGTDSALPKERLAPAESDQNKQPDPATPEHPAGIENPTDTESPVDTESPAGAETPVPPEKEENVPHEPGRVTPPEPDPTANTAEHDSGATPDSETAQPADAPPVANDGAHDKAAQPSTPEKSANEQSAQPGNGTAHP